MSCTLQCQAQTEFSNECDALQLLKAAETLLTELSAPLPVESFPDQKDSCLKKQTSIPSLKKHPSLPSQDKTVPPPFRINKYKKKKQSLPVNSFPDQQDLCLKEQTSAQCLKKHPSLPSRAKSVPPVFTISKKKKMMVGGLSAGPPPALSLPNQETAVPSFEMKKSSILEPFSAYPAPSFSLPSQEETVPSFENQKKAMLQPLSACPAPAPTSAPAPAPDPIPASSPSLSPGPSAPSLSLTSQDKTVPSFEKKKKVLEPFSACPAPSPSLPSQEKTVPVFTIKKKKKIGEPFPTFPAPSDSSLQKSSSLPSLSLPDSKKGIQKALGPQSLRGGRRLEQFEVLNGNAHAESCFQDLLSTEENMCAEWAFFYHSYSTSALIYEVQAAIAAVLFGFRSQDGTLPRILVDEFAKFPDAAALQKSFQGVPEGSEWRGAYHDGKQEYMSVGLSAMCSLLAYGPESSPTADFCKGYRDSWDPDLSEVLKKLLKKCCVPEVKIKKLMKNIIKLSEKYGLDVSSFNGKACKSQQPGHLLQICIRRDIVNDLTYASLPFGHPDKSRQPMSRFMDGDSSFDFGQARVLARPEYFMEPDAVRLHTVSADPQFHSNRADFQTELTKLLSVALGDASLQETAAKGIYGKKLPEGWTPYAYTRFSRPRASSKGARHRIKV